MTKDRSIWRTCWDGKNRYKEHGSVAASRPPDLARAHSRAPQPKNSVLIVHENCCFLTFQITSCYIKLSWVTLGFLMQFNALTPHPLVVPVQLYYEQGGYSMLEIQLGGSVRFQGRDQTINAYWNRKRYLAYSEISTWPKVLISPRKPAGGWEITAFCQLTSRTVHKCHETQRLLISRLR